MVYGLSNAPTSPDGTSHWGDAKVVGALGAAAVLLVAFAIIEARSRHALLPLRLLRDRDRLGANLIMLGVGTALFGVFFFLTVLVQNVWGYSPLRTGLAFLPFTATMLASSGAAASLIARVGARPLLATGAACCGGGLYWLSLVSEHGTYAGALLGPILVIGAGLGQRSSPTVPPAVPPPLPPPLPATLPVPAPGARPTSTRWRPDLTARSWSRPPSRRCCWWSPSR